VTSGNGKSDLHKQNVSVCFFTERKCRNLTEHIIFIPFIHLWGIQMLTYNFFIDSVSFFFLINGINSILQ
jgi:hypothetical protein